MVKASPEQQRKLLDLQQLDRKLAQYAHERRTHPTIGVLEEIQGRLDDLGRARIELETELSDVGRELRQAENAVEQVERRLKVQQQRLDSGQVNAKDMVAITSELEVLGNRRASLEETQLEIMERHEGLEEKLSHLSERESAMATQHQDQSRIQAQAFAQIDRDAAVVTDQRGELAASFDAGLLDLYEYIRSRTGGLAVVAVKNGQAVDGMVLSLSVTERAALAAAAPDDVYEAEESGYILVRMD